MPIVELEIRHETRPRTTEKKDSNMPQLTFETLKREAERRGLLLERVDRTRDGVRSRYEITDETGVWERCSTLADVQKEIVDWENKDMFFVV